MLKSACDEIAQLDPEAVLEDNEAEGNSSNIFDDLEDHDNSETLSTNADLNKPEELSPWLPSRDPSLAKPELCTIELELRQSQGMECVQKIRTFIGQKSVLIRYLVRRNQDTGQGRCGRSWKEVGTVHRQLILAWAGYCRTHAAIKRLPNSEEAQATLLPIEKSHLAELKDITEANRYSQRSDVLPWFWTMHGTLGSHSDAMEAGMW
jgi:hypothetical protein